MAPCDFFLFLKMKIQLKGQRFDTIKEIQEESHQVLNKVMLKDFQNTFQSWEKHWDQCLHSQGGYFEGDGGD